MTAPASTPAPVMPQPKVPHDVAVVLARGWSPRQSRHRMQRAARIYGGTMTLRDKVATFPDKGWAVLILVGCAFVFSALGFAMTLVVESVIR